MTESNNNHNTISLHDIVTRSPDQIDMLIEDLFPSTGIVGFIGDTGLGKSSLIMQLGIFIAYGMETFLGRKINSKHNRSLYISTEDDVHNIGPRLKKMLKTLGLSISDDGSYNMEIVNAYTDIPELIDMVLSDKPHDLVVIDSFSDLLRKDGNSVAEVRNILKPLGQIAGKHQCLILIIHHVRKSGVVSPTKYDTLGSSAFEQKLRLLISLIAGDRLNEVKLRIAKSNYLPAEIKSKDLILEFKDMAFNLIDEKIIKPPLQIIKQIKSEEAMHKAISELGVKAQKKDLLAKAKEFGYEFGNSKFYTDVDPYLVENVIVKS